MIDNIDDFKQELDSSDGKAVIVWKADWCGPCKAMAPIIDEISKQNPSVKLLTVDIEGDGIDSVLKEYGVRAVPTFTKIDNGVPTKNASGTLNKQDLSTFFTSND